MRSNKPWRAEQVALPWDVPGLVAGVDEAVEEADTEARGPAVVGFGLRRIHRGPGDVEMDPGHVLDEALDELGAGDGAGSPAAGILDVGDLGIHRLVVFLAERHPPHGLASRDAGRDQHGAAGDDLRDAVAQRAAEQAGDDGRDQRQEDN